jgi:hypothetical protein
MFIRPGTSLSIDEAMAKCKGRTRDITVLPGKPIPEGYKVWICAYRGYVYAFELHSREASAERSNEARPVISNDLYMEAFNATTPNERPLKIPRGGHRLAETQALVYRFAKDLPKEYSWVLYLDNLFVNQVLLALLRKDLGVGAMGTTRKNARGIPWQLLDRKEEKHQWGSTFPMIVGDVLVALWQDNAKLIFMITAHSLHNPEDLVVVNRKKPALNANNKAIIEPVFGNNTRKELPIPKPIDDYNQFMNGGDVANQLRATSDMQRRESRTWRSLFMWFFKQSIVNAFRIQQWSRKVPNDRAEEDEECPLTGHRPKHRRFRESLIASLWSYSGETGPTAPEALVHEWTRLPTKHRKCKECRAQGGTRVLKTTALRKTPLGVASSNIGASLGRISTTSWGCKQCDVALCREGGCWEDFHRVE